MPRRPELEGGSGVQEQTRTKKRLEKPKLYKVLLHNDHYTTMEFVVSVLRQVFGHPAPAAQRIMLNVHEQGYGVAGVYTHEIAETKAEKTMALARASEFPLLATVEED